MAHGKKSKKANPSNKNYTTSKRWIANKTKKLERHLKKHPSDGQSAHRDIVKSYGGSIPAESAKKVLADRRWKSYLKGVL